MSTTRTPKVLIHRCRGVGTQATTWEPGHGHGKALDCGRDSMDGEPNVFTRDDLIAILLIQLAFFGATVLGQIAIFNDNKWFD
jgi:hypothetical protein